MPFTFQARTDAPLFRAFARRASRTYACCVGAFSAVLGLIGAGLLHDYEPAAVGIAMAGGFALFGPGYIADQVIRKNPAKIGLVRAYRLDDRGIHIAAGFEEMFIAWPEIMAVEERKGFFAVFTGPRFAAVPGRRLTMQFGRRVTPVPTGGLTDQQRSQLRELLRSRGVTATDPVATT